MSLCSLFKPLSSHWLQPCSSLGRLINSIINAKRKESPSSFLIATHACEYELQADRKQGPMPRDAPLPASGALHLPMPSWTTWPHLPGAAIKGEGGDGLQQICLEVPSLVDKPCSEQREQVKSLGRGVRAPSLGWAQNPTVMPSTCREEAEVDGKHAQ